MRTWDRAAEDLGNIVNLGHVNYRVPDQIAATEYYIAGLGLTRDPAMMTATNNMWVNVGDSQFHLPTGDPVVGPGIVTGLVVPDLDKLRERLDRVKRNLKDTKFSVVSTNDYVESTCPWGNRVRCHEADEMRFGPVALGMAYVADGRTDGYVELHINSWDCLAGILLVNEAGAAIAAKPVAEITQADGTWITMSGDQGRYHQPSGHLLMMGHVHVLRDDGFEFFTSLAHMDTRSGTAWGDEHVDGQGPSGEITADGFRIYDHGRTVTFLQGSSATVSGSGQKDRPTATGTPK